MEETVGEKRTKCQSAEGKVLLWEWGTGGEGRQVFGEMVWEEGAGRGKQWAQEGEAVGQRRESKVNRQREEGREGPRPP